MWETRKDGASTLSWPSRKGASRAIVRAIVRLRVWQPSRVNKPHFIRLFAFSKSQTFCNFQSHLASTNLTLYCHIGPSELGGIPKLTYWATLRTFCWKKTYCIPQIDSLLTRKKREQRICAWPVEKLVRNRHEKRSLLIYLSGDWKEPLNRLVPRFCRKANRCHSPGTIYDQPSLCCWLNERLNSERSLLSGKYEEPFTFLMTSMVSCWPGYENTILPYWRRSDCDTLCYGSDEDSIFQESVK